VVVVMMENLSYNQVVGSANAPFQTSLASQCGVATDDFGATHASASNYFAVSGGQFPATSPQGCSTAAACATAQDNLYDQLNSAGLSWGGFMESMPSGCSPTGSGVNTSTKGLYQVGHNPIVFYTDLAHAQCVADDVGVPDLTAHAGAFYTDLQNQTLPAFSWVTPNGAHDGEGAGTQAQSERAGDTWLSAFLGTVQQSNSYQAGNTLVLVTYDEGSGADARAGEDCTQKSLDLPVTNGVSAHQDSCHVPLFVAYPYTPAGARDTAFFDHYSITKTVEDLFGLPHLAHAGDAQTASLLGHLGIPSGGTSGTSAPVFNSAVSTCSSGSVACANSAITTAHLPSGTAPGDALLMFVSWPDDQSAVSVPAGWHLLGKDTSSPLESNVYYRAATSSDLPTASVQVRFATAMRNSVTVADYSGVDVSAIEAFATSSDTGEVSHTTPRVVVTSADSLAVSYWADKSSTTTAWTLPADIRRDSAFFGVGGGRITSVLGDSVSRVGIGTYGNKTATTNAPSGKATEWTVILAAAAAG
jgi:Phosphoesterase family